MGRWTTVLAAAAVVLAACPAATRAADPPQVTITGGPVGPTNDSAPLFTFTVDDPMATVTCVLDGPKPSPEAPCSQQVSFADLIDGAYLFTVRASDSATGTGSATREFTVDTVSPDATIGAGPPAVTNQASASFELNASEPGAVFECRLTGPGHEADDFAACDRTKAYTGLGDGSYTFEARAVDAAGNRDHTPAMRTFTIDTTPPAAPALSGTPAAFAFSSTDPGARFECALDGPAGPGAFQACAAPYSLPGLAPGTYSLRVRAVDAAGNAGPAAALGFTIAAPLPAPPPPLPLTSPLPPPPTPVFHLTVVGRPGLADVRVRLPGSSRFVRLAADRALPLGTTIDTRRGAVQLVTVARRNGKPQRATFDGGVFRVTQRGAMTVLTLTGRVCPGTRRLAGNGRGAFQVRGRYSAATVRGTRWVVRDSCAGTLTRVLEGVVQVRDEVRRRTVLVRAGRRFLARPKA